MTQGAGDRNRERLPIAGTLTRVVEVYRRRWRLLVAVGIVVGIPIGLIDAIAGTAADADVESTAAAVGLAGAALGGFLIVLLAGQFLEGVYGEAALAVRTGGEVPSVAILLRELPYLAMFLTTVLFVLGTALGAFLLLVPGVIFFTWYSPAVALVALERRGIRAAFGHSRRLVRGSFWRVLLLSGGAYLATSTLGDGVQALADGVIGEGLIGDWAVAVLSEVVLTTFAALTTVVMTLELIELHGEPMPEAP